MEIPMGNDKNFKNFYFENHIKIQNKISNNEPKILNQNTVKSNNQTYINLSFKGNKFISHNS